MLDVRCSMVHPVQKQLSAYGVRGQSSRIMTFLFDLSVCFEPVPVVTHYEAMLNPIFFLKEYRKKTVESIQKKA